MFYLDVPFCSNQVRVSAVLTNAPYFLNLDCDHYINNSKALREAMCFMMDPQLGKKVCYVQFPQRFDGIDRSDRYANHNTVFFDVSNGVVSYLYFSWVIALWVLNVWQFVHGTPKTTGITGIRVCTRWS